MTTLHRAVLELLADGAALWCADGALHFRAPSGVMTAERAAFLRGHKAELLAWLAACGAERDRPLIETAPPRAPRHGDAAPLSPAQEDILFAQRLGCGSAYNMPALLTLTGELDIEALAHSLDDLRARHASLRTRVIETADGAQQIADAPASMPLATQDLGALAAQAQAAAVEALAAQWADERFDLAAGPLLRAKLLILGGGQYRLLLNLHHIIADGWSMSVLAADLAECYRARVLGVPCRLAPLSHDYSDYAWMQRVRAEQRVWARDVPFWRAALQGAPERLTLPHDRTRPPVRSFEGDEVLLRIDAQTSARLKSLAASWRMTPFAPLCALFQLLLSRWSQQNDVVVGVAAANRRFADSESAIGLFVEMLPIRTQIEDADSFETLARRVKAHMDEASTHTGVPFSELANLSGVQRDRSCPPLVPAVFVFDNTPDVVLELPSLTVRQQRLKTTTSKFDLTLFMREENGAFAGYLEYATDLFDKATMQRFVDSFCTLLADALAHIERPCHALQIVPADDLQVLLHARHGAPLPFDRTARIHDLIAQQAAAHPTRTAICTDEGSMSYAQLDARSNALAHVLQARGVTPETVVGVCLSRTPTMIVAMLAILKAGGAYLPLDASYPIARLKLMAEDCRARFTLTEQRYAQTLEGAGELLLLDTLTPQATAEDRYAPPCRASASSLAYIIYTSGSTGRPKGVAIEHRNVLALLAWAVDEYRDGELSNVIACTSICFDISIFEIFVPLMTGGTVTLAQGPLALPAVASHARILNTVPSAAAELVAQGAVPASVDVVNVAGEPLSPRLVAAIYAHTRAKRVYNLYGPSEDTTYSTFARVARGADPVPVGLPLPNTQLYVLDQHRQLVPSGVAGELYIGGAGVTRGYFGRPELTAERYIEHPLAGEGRLYKTGDLVRFGADGQLYCLGRCDQQIKIRGFRIEIGEIEAALLAHPSVENAAVLARENNNGERFLAAYVMARANASDGKVPDAAALRAHLRESLTEAMIPAVFVVLDEFPLLPNGKIDKSALPAVLPRESHGAQAHARPTNEREAAIAAIWSAVLAIEAPDIHTDFFALGGHSLKAARVLHLIEQRLSVRLPLAALFRDTTIAQLAARIAEHTQTPCAAAPASLRLMREGHGTSALFLFHPAGGHLFGYATLIRQLRFDGPIYGLQRPEFAGADSPTLIDADTLAERYAAQIRTAQPHGPYRLLGWSFGGLMAGLVAARLRASGEAVVYAGAIDTRLPPRLDPAADAALAACDGQSVAQAHAGLPPALIERVQAMARADAAIAAASADDALLRERLSALYLADLWALAMHTQRGAAAGEPLEALTHAYDASLTVAADADASTTAAGAPTRTYEGDHFAILRMPAAQTVAQWVDADLAEAAVPATADALP